MITCSQCRFWGQVWSSGRPPEGMGVCGKISDSERDPNAKAFVAFSYDLVTRPEFGCVLGESSSTPRLMTLEPTTPDPDS